MKKLLALLLTLCMVLPSAALADAVTYRYEMHIGEDAYRTLLTEALQQSFGELDGQDEIIDAVTKLVCGILDVSTVECTVQDNGLELAVLLQDARLLSAAVTIEENALIASTSLVDDTVFVLDLTEAMETVASVDWATLVETLSSTALEWYVTREAAYDVSGNFAGAAYDNGNERLVITLDDEDIALLLEGLLLDIEQSDLLTVITGIAGEDAVKAALMEIRAFNYKAALNNEFDYELSIAHRTEGLTSKLVGASLNVLRNGEEAWSLSIGGEGKNFSVIAAFHVDGMTNYFAFTQTVETVSSREETGRVTFGIYQAEQGVSYAEASADPAAALMYYEYAAKTEMTGMTSHYRRTTEAEEKGMMNGTELPRIRMTQTEEYAESPFSQKIESITYTGDDTAAFCTARISAAEAESFAHDENAKRISVAELAVNTVLQDEVMAAAETGVNKMSVIAMQNIPAELLLYILQLAQ